MDEKTPELVILTHTQYRIATTIPDSSLWKQIRGYKKDNKIYISLPFEWNFVSIKSLNNISFVIVNDSDGCNITYTLPPSGVYVIDPNTNDLINLFE